MSDKDDILAIHRKWIALEESGHPDGVLEFCSEDVAWLVPDFGPVRGKAAVRNWLKDQPHSPIERIETSNLVIEVSGDLAVKRTDFVTRFASDDEYDVIRGTHVWTLRRIEDRWQVTAVAWSVAGPSTILV